MPVKYTGPNLLRGIVEETYGTISGDYHRQNPALVIGFPYRVEGIPSTYRGFESQDKMNSFVDDKIMQLQRANKDLLKRDRLFQELSAASFYDRDTSAKGSFFYSDANDAMFFDAKLATMFLLGQGKITRGLFGKGVNYDSDLRSSLGHELVHNDLGLSLPKVEFRGHAQQQKYVLQSWQRAADSIQRGKDTFRDWKLGEGREFLEMLQRSHGSTTPDAAKREIERCKELIARIEQRMQDLNIRIGEEALAYNFGLGRDNFIVAIRNDGKDAFMGILLTAYDSLEGKIKSEGKLAAIKHMELAINASWTEDRDLTGLLL